MIDESRAALHHRCRLPVIVEYGGVDGIPARRVLYEIGTRYHCPCGVVHVVHYTTGGRQRSGGYAPAGYVWRVETRRERRRRLGRRWWQW